MYYLYILKCSDGSLYTGIAKNLKERLSSHREGTGSKYVRARLPFKLLYKEKHKNRSLASKREYEIKSWSRDKKIENLDLEL
jgi:putative endonuclease